MMLAPSGYCFKVNVYVYSQSIYRYVSGARQIGKPIARDAYLVLA